VIVFAGETKFFDGWSIILLRNNAGSIATGALAAGSFLSSKELLRSRAAGSPWSSIPAPGCGRCLVARQLRMTTFL
jgi:hypothetical protein